MSSARNFRPRPVTEISLDRFVVWAYRDQLVDRMTARSLEQAERGLDPLDASPPSIADSMARIARIGALGCHVDGGGRSWDCHQDAERLHEIVCGMDRRAARLIADHGRAGTPPDWQSPPASFRAVPVPPDAPGAVRHKIDLWWYRIDGAKPKIARGESAVIAPANGAWDVGCRFCPVVLSPPPEYAARLRAGYAAWHAAMVALWERVGRVGFRDYAVTGVMARERPWE